MIKDRRVIVLLNKSDMESVLTKEQIREHIECPILLVSAKNETGIKELSDTIKKMFLHGVKRIDCKP